jgi:DNA replication and repair protein RecF
MPITHISLYQFRCFQQYKLDVHPKLTIIAGPNGSGKTSILEAIQSASSLRSFRTPTLSDMILEGTDVFSVHIKTALDTIHVAYGRQRRVVEINDEGPVNRLTLMKRLPIITITEQDMSLIDGGPAYRRAFCDYTAALQHDAHAVDLRKLAAIVKQRTMLLSYEGRWNKDVYMILTEQLWEVSARIRQRRQQVCTDLLPLMLCALEDSRISYKVTLQYLPHEDTTHLSAEQWCQQQEARERALRRTLCGAHLDDLDWCINGMNARRHASRGLQKLLMVFARAAQAQLLPKATFLLDDIMADFDDKRLEDILPIVIKAAEQIVLTLPMFDSAGEHKVITYLRHYDHAITWL